MTDSIKAAVRATLRRSAAPVPPNAVAALAHYVTSRIGGDLSARIFGQIMSKEGFDAIHSMAERFAAGRFYLDVLAWAPDAATPIEAVTVGVGLVYGPREAAVMDFHVVRAAHTTAPRVPRAALLEVVKSVGRFCDKHKIWCYGGSRWGVFAHIAQRYPHLGFTRMETTYAHADGARYEFFIRPPC